MPTFVPPALKIARHKSVFEESVVVTAPRDIPSEIVAEFLYLGSAKSAANAVEMHRLGISRYLCCAEEVPFPAHLTEESIAAGTVRVLRIPMKDGVKTHLRDHFATAFRFLREAKRDCEPVLVFCREGKSRSASITIAYLMRYAAMKYEEAIAVVRSRRAVVDPNVGFCSQLNEFSAAMEAERRGGNEAETEGQHHHGSFPTRSHAGPYERVRSVKIVTTDADSLGSCLTSQPMSNCQTPKRGDAEHDTIPRVEFSPKVLSATRTPLVAKSATRSSIQGSASAYDLRETLLRQLGDGASLSDTSNALAVSVLGLSLRSPSLRDAESEVTSPAALLSRSESTGMQSRGSHDPDETLETEDELVEPLLDESEMTVVLLDTPGSPNQRGPMFPNAPA